MPNDPIDDVRDDPLDKRELQETRYANGKVLRDMVDPDEIKKRHEQHDLMWWALGWIPLTAKRWGLLLAVTGGVVLVGGQDFIDNVASYFGGLLP